MNIYEEIIKIGESATAAALCILTNVLGSAPQITGAKMIVTAKGEIVGTVGGGAIEKKIIELAQSVISSGRPENFTFNLVKDLGMACGGQVQVYIEPIEARRHLIIFGAGHIALPTCTIARMLGFQVTVVDDRPEWANSQRFADANHVVVADFIEFVNNYPFSKKDYLLIVTRGHALDQAIAEVVIRKDFAWLGMIGSKRKVAAILAHLRAKGISEAEIARLESPVGLAIGAVSPEEIAVSIAARLVEHRRSLTNIKK